MIGLGEAEGQCHGEAPGVRRPEQLLGIGSPSILEPGPKRVLRLESSAPDADGSVSGLGGPFPVGVRCSLWHRCLPFLGHC